MTDTSKEAVVRLALFGTEGAAFMAPAKDGRYVRATDYDALAQRCADLEAEKRRILTEAETAEGLLKTAYVRAERAEAERDAIAAAMVEAAERACAGIAGDPRMYSSGHRRGAGQCQAAIRTLTPADALAKLAAIRAEERAAGRREVVNRLQHEIIIKPAMSAAEVIEWAEFAAMEKEQGE